MIEKGLKFTVETKENTAFLITKNGLKTKKIENRIDEYIVIEITNDVVTCQNINDYYDKFICTPYYLGLQFKINSNWKEVK